MRIGINVPDELLQRLAPLKPELNISQVCREALEAKASSYERMRAQIESSDVRQAMGHDWEREQEFRAIIAVDWEQLGYEDAAAWVQAASADDWRYVHDIQDVIKKQPWRPAWAFGPPPPRELPNFDSRVDEIHERMNQQSDEFFDWLCAERGSPAIDYAAAQREYMTAWLAYVNEAWALFLKEMERDYAEERSKQRQETRNAHIQPQVPAQLLNRLSVDYQKIITTEPGKRSGQPCIRGMRITVYDVLEYLAGGMTEAEIRADFPELTHEDILACYAFAAEPKRRIQHPQPADPAHLLPVSEPDHEPQPEKPPFRVIPNHSKLVPGVESTNLNHLVGELDDERFLAEMEQDRVKESESEPKPQPGKKPFRVIPHHGKFAPGVAEMNLNHLNAQLEEEELLAKLARSGPMKRDQEKPQ